MPVDRFGSKLRFPLKLRALSYAARCKTWDKTFRNYDIGLSKMFRCRTLILKLICVKDRKKNGFDNMTVCSIKSYEYDVFKNVTGRELMDLS